LLPVVISAELTVWSPWNTNQLVSSAAEQPDGGEKKSVNKTKSRHSKEYIIFESFMYYLTFLFFEKLLKIQSYIV